MCLGAFDPANLVPPMKVWSEMLNAIAQNAVERRISFQINEAPQRTEPERLDTVHQGYLLNTALIPPMMFSLTSRCSLIFPSHDFMLGQDCCCDRSINSIHLPNSTRTSCSTVSIYSSIDTWQALFSLSILVVAAVMHWIASLISR